MRDTFENFNQCPFSSCAEYHSLIKKGQQQFETYCLYGFPGNYLIRQQKNPKDSLCPRTLKLSSKKGPEQGLLLLCVYCSTLSQFTCVAVFNSQDLWVNIKTRWPLLWTSLENWSCQLAGFLKGTSSWNIEIATCYSAPIFMW